MFTNQKGNEVGRSWSAAEWPLRLATCSRPWRPLAKASEGVLPMVASASAREFLASGAKVQRGALPTTRLAINPIHRQQMTAGA